MLTLCAALVGSIPGAASGQDAEKPTLSGSWSASAMKEAWSTKEWGEDCGPKPTSGGGAPGGNVTVVQQGGELSFSGAGRSFTTAECWEQLPGMKRVSHSGGARGWTTKCASPKGDPRRATVTTNITATDETIVFQETGIFEWGIKDSVCKASVGRSRTFKLLQRAGAAPAPTAAPTADPAPPPPPAPSPAKSAAPSEGCDAPGPPGRIEVRPSTKLLRPGESFTPAVRVSDAKGCRLAVEPEVRQAEGEGAAPKLHIEGTKITAAADSPAGKATIGLSLGGKTVDITVEVAPADQYEELLKLRGLNDLGEDDRSAVAEIAAGIGGTASEAEDNARARKRTFMAIVGVVAGLLGVVGLALWRRGKARRDDDDERVSVVPPSNVAIFETTARRRLECSRCGRDYAPGTGFCEDDGTALVPSMMPSPLREDAPPSAPTPKPSSRPKKQLDKICPSCGDRFPSEAEFCGKDGTQLVPVN